MANFLLNSIYDWSYNNKYSWSFYKNANIFYIGSEELNYSYTATSENLYSFRGNGIKVADKSITSGFFDSFYSNTAWRDIYISEFNVSAKSFGTLMEKQSETSSIEIYKLIFSGDDIVTLGFGNDTVSTFDGDDTIYGRAGNDAVNGGAGDDIIYGGTGNDTLTGYSGADVFVFDTKPSTTKNIDTITDFSVKNDVIALDHLIFRKVGHAGELASSAFLGNGTGKAADASDRIIYNNKTGILYYDADGSGSSVAVAFARLDAGLKLTADNFDIL